MVILKWSTIRSLLESKVSLTLAVALSVVPLLPVLHLPVTPQTAFLYFAALLFFLANIIHIIARPSLLKYPDLSSFEATGRSPRYVYDQYIELCGDTSTINDVNIQTGINQFATSGTISNKAAYWYAYDNIDIARQSLLWLQVIVLSLSISFLVYVNLSRAMTVWDAMSSNTSGSDRSQSKGATTHTPLIEQLALRAFDTGLRIVEGKMANPMSRAFIAGLTVGKEADVRYNSPNGIETASGKILNYDDDGYLIIEKKNGEQVMIPKERVIDVTLMPLKR